MVSADRGEWSWQELSLLDFATSMGTPFRAGRKNWEDAGGGGNDSANMIGPVNLTKRYLLFF